MTTAPFAPNDTVVALPRDPNTKFKSRNILPKLIVGNVYTVADCTPGWLYNARLNHLEQTTDHWLVYLVGIDHPFETKFPNIRTGYPHYRFRKAISTDISALKELLNSTPCLENTS